MASTLQCEYDGRQFQESTPSKEGPLLYLLVSRLSPSVEMPLDF